MNTKDFEEKKKPIEEKDRNPLNASQVDAVKKSQGQSRLVYRLAETVRAVRTALQKAIKDREKRPKRGGSSILAASCRVNVDAAGTGMNQTALSIIWARSRIALTVV